MSTPPLPPNRRNKKRRQGAGAGISMNTQKAIAILLETSSHGCLLTTIIAGFQEDVVNQNYLLGVLLLFAASSIIIAGGMQLVGTNKDEIVKTGTVMSLFGYFVFTVAVIMMWADAKDILSRPGGGATHIRFLFVMNSTIYLFSLLVLAVLASYVCKEGQSLIQEEGQEQPQNNYAATTMLRAWRRPPY